MAVVLTCEIEFNDIHPESNVYAVASEKDLVLTNILHKNEITSLLTNQRDNEFFRHVIVKMTNTAENPATYTAKFLQSVVNTLEGEPNFVSTTNKGNIVFGDTYYVYVMVDSRNTDAKNKTALHVYQATAN